MLPLPWPFEREYMQLALGAALITGICAPLLGTFLVQKHLSLMGDGLGHVAFAGVGAGLLLDVWPLWSALVVAVAAAMTIEWLRSRRRAAGDLVLALFFYSGIAGGVVMAGVDGSLNAGVLRYLFGSLLTVERGELAVVAALGAATIVAVAVGWRALFAVVLDEEAARAAGLPVDRLNLALAALVAITVVGAMRVVGLLLVAALMVLPVGGAQRLARSFFSTLVWSACIGALAAVVGLVVARVWDLAPGGTIVLVASAAFVLSGMVAGRRPLRSPVLSAGRPGSGP